jgi:hypothetical protein
MPQAFRLSLNCWALSDSNIVFGLLVLDRLLRDGEFLSLRNQELKEEGFVGFIVEHQGTNLFFEICLEEVTESRVSSLLEPWWL